jgi:predicted TPR repeat methyltransferase
MKMMYQHFDTMRIDEARRVLDLGCGTGAAGRSILKIRHGRLVGLGRDLIDAPLLGRPESAF